jgi:hypothetical protein
MIALNEEKFIARALSSCTFADEIVVVDGGSTDRTIDLLQSHAKVKIVHHSWEGHFGNQRQMSLQHCTGNWVIRLDADEVFSEMFAENIKGLLERTGDDVAGYRIRQCNLVGNENYYSKSADKFESIPRIWRNERGIRWESAIHESLTGFSGRILDWDIYVVHYGFLDKFRYLEKARRYSETAGSLVNRVEDLVYRDYDFQPVPERAKVASHVAPYSIYGQRHSKPRIAMVRGPHLNLPEMRSLASLQEIFDLTVFTTCLPPADLRDDGIPIVTLPKDPMVATAMAGLEYALFDTDIIFVTQIVWPYTYQAIMAKQKFGKKVVALQTDDVPFAYEANEALKKLKEYNRPNVDAFVAVTDKARDALLVEGVPSEKITVIPVGFYGRNGEADEPFALDNTSQAMAKLFRIVNDGITVGNIS